VRIAAILSLPDGNQGEESTSPAKSSPHARLGGLGGTSFARFDILGQSLLDRTLTRIERIGAVPHTVISQGKSTELLPARSGAPNSFVTAWEKSVTKYVNDGVDVLLLVRVAAYADIDFAQFVKFHLETNSPMTQLYAGETPLDVALLDASRLRNAEGTYRHTLRALIPQQRRLDYQGYVNRLASPVDFYTLVEDGLRGRCGLRPIGQETQQWVWQGRDAEIDRSAVITGPAFIGEEAQIGACCTIAAGSSIERNCEVDCGTTVEESWVMQDTYIGAALDVRRAIVGHDSLFHLDRNIEVKVGDPDLIGTAQKSAALFGGLGSLIWGREAAG
jgi:hypothetical protein